MRTNTLGASGLQVSDICRGIMPWGGQNSEAESHAQIDCAQ